MRIKEILEASTISQIKPGQSAEIDHGDGTKTVVDLKKNPAALSKDAIGKVKLNKKPDPNKRDPATLVKQGDKVDIDD
jgi:hypothetical protein